MEEQIYKKRLSALRKNLGRGSEGKYDTAWIIQPENRRYCSGFTAEDTQCNESSGSLLISAATRPAHHGFPVYLPCRKRKHQIFQ